ncbi:MAG: DUF4230 domain-containing protein [Salinibacter sp.]
MLGRTRTIFGVGLLVGLFLSIGVAVWWTQGPSTSEVRRTVITTVQAEAPASFLVTGTLTLSVTVRIDSAQYMTPDWLTYALRRTQPSVLPMLRGSSQTRVKVPGRVSYGFDVQALSPEMITVEEGGVVAVDLPALSVHSVEPRLSRLQVQTRTQGWMRVFPSTVNAEVREQALSAVRDAFRAQADKRIATATQPRVNTARALKKMLRPPLTAAGLENPTFRIRVRDRLILQPREGGQNVQN